MQQSAEWVDIQSLGKRKFVHRWLPDDQAQACVCLIHGLGEHGGRYHSLAGDFVKAGFAVHAFDQQGHGHSPERRGFIKSYLSLLEDIQAFCCWSAQQFPALPLFLFGHSMGGNLVINYALRDYSQPCGVISSSPMIEQVRPLNPWFVRLARLALWVAPNITLRSHVVAERLMSDPHEQQALKEDQLFHSQLTLRLGGGLIDSGAWALRNADKLKIKLLLTHGTADYLTSPMASMEFARRAGEACQLKILEGALHDPFRAADRETVVGLYLSFLNKLVVGSSNR